MRPASIDKKSLLVIDFGNNLKKVSVPLNRVNHKIKAGNETTNNEICTMATKKANIINPLKKFDIGVS